MVTDEQCRQILGVGPDTTAEGVRQAYLDLARVWHPDRFQSDERLCKIAGERLREINEAYAVLKNYRPPESRQASPPAPAPASAPGWTSPVTPPPFRRFGSLALGPWTISKKAACTTGVTVVLAAPFVAASLWANLLRVPSLDTNLISSQAFQAFQPKILSPMRVIDPHSDILEAADALTTWARGDAIDLWKPVRYSGPDSPAAVATAGGDHRKARAGAPGNDGLNRPAATVAQPVPPLNGADLIPDGRQAGVGELRLSNHTGLEAVFKLMSERRMRRAVYLAPNGSVTLRSIPVGIYDLHVELGNDLDVEHLHFLSGRATPTPLGPFQFLQVTSETGISGNHYEVVLNPQ